MYFIFSNFLNKKPRFIYYILISLCDNLYLQKLHINGAHCKANSVSYNMEAQGYVSFELILQPTTVVTYYGMHEDGVAIPVVAAPQEVTFETINQEQVQVPISKFNLLK